MAKCVACGSKAKIKKIGLDYCKICGINFSNRLKQIQDSKDINSLKNSYLKASNAIEIKDNYNEENKKKVISYFERVYHIQKESLEIEKEEELNKNIIFEVNGANKRYLEVYQNKIIIYVNVSTDSFTTGNMTDGKKTIYYKDVIGLQFKPSDVLVGYLQLETASSLKNNMDNNVFNENTFTFDTTTTSNKYNNRKIY